MIGTWDYRYLSDIIDESTRLGKDCLEPLLCMRREVLNADIDDFNRFRTRLNANIESTYVFIMNKHLNFNNPLASAVRALNEHVLRNYGHTSLDDFLVEQFLEVPPVFAQISNAIGFPVTEIGMASARWEDINSNWEAIGYIDMDKIGWSNV